MLSMNLSGAEAAYFKRFARWKIIVLFLTLALLLSITFAVTIGPMHIQPLDVYMIIIKNIPLIGNLVDSGASSVEEVIVIQVRLPRVLAAAIVGIALAVAGVVFRRYLEIRWPTHM